MMRRIRTRVAVGLVSAGAIGLELALMRAFSFRFWHHFAYMVISVALLGFGASGTALVFFRGRIAGRERVWIAGAAVGFALSVPLAMMAAQAVPVNVGFLAWDLGEAFHVAAVELLVLVPFLFAGGAIGIALTEGPEHVGGHYAANLVGSGAGAIAALALMWHLTTPGLFVAVSAAGYVGGAVLVPWRRVGTAALYAAAGAAIVVLALGVPYRPRASQYKMLSHLEETPGTEFIGRAEGPLGRIDAAAGPAVHYAPGLALAYTGEVPEHTLLLSDGEVLGAVYDTGTREDWGFLDYTTAAVGHHVRGGGRTLVIGAGGGADIGLALYHGSGRVVALEMNPQVIEMMEGPLWKRGGGIYGAAGVEVVNAEARGWLGGGGEAFDVIGLGVVEGYGASTGGVYAAQESYLYTVESFEQMMGRLGEGGVLCVTRRAETPPREGLRVFDTAAEALRREGLDPGERVVMIRSWATVTVVVSKRAFDGGDVASVRAFCEKRGFDVCRLPGLGRSEVNRFHVLDRPYYFEAAGELLGARREGFIAAYPFAIEAATDDRPYFFHFLTLRSLGFLEEQLGRRSRAFLEAGHLVVLAALVQTVVLAAVFLGAPLAARVRGLLGARGKGATSAYFVFLGCGFMLLEMCFLQKLVLYLAHPVHAAAAVISGFLVFAGVGSRASRMWRWRRIRTAAFAAGAVVLLSLVYSVGLGRWLALTQSQPMAVRFLVAGGTIAPLAFAMGHMFPLGLSRVGRASGELVPWAWALNGFASVGATVAAPLLALEVGFSMLALAGACCYILAGAVFFALPGGGAQRDVESGG